MWHILEYTLESRSGSIVSEAGQLDFSDEAIPNAKLYFLENEPVDIKISSVDGITKVKEIRPVYSRRLDPLKIGAENKTITDTLAAINNLVQKNQNPILCLDCIQDENVPFSISNSYNQKIGSINFINTGFLRAPTQIDASFLQIYCYDLDSLNKRTPNDNFKVPDYEDYVNEWKYIFSLEPIHYTELPYHLIIADHVSIETI